MLAQLAVANVLAFGNGTVMAAVLQKDRLIRTTPSPKIILVGGSNLAFGIDSRLLQDSLHVNVVNMGLYAKLGLRYMLAQVKPYIRAGDIVIVVPEYDQFYGSFSEGDNTLNTALLYAPADRISDFVKSYSVIDVVFRPRVENVRRSFLVAAADAVGAAGATTIGMTALPATISPGGKSTITATVAASWTMRCSEPAPMASRSWKIQKIPGAWLSKIPE